MNYSDPPGGKIGEVASRAIANPKLQLEQDLSNLKDILEGEATPEEIQQRPAASTVQSGVVAFLTSGGASCSWGRAYSCSWCSAGGEAEAEEPHHLGVSVLVVGGSNRGGEGVNKTELIEEIAQRSDSSEAQAQRYTDTLEKILTEALKGAEEVQITGFGKFYVREQKAREGVNPQTRERIRTPAQKVPAFSAGQGLKQAL